MAVLVPAAVHELDEADAALGHATGQQAVSSEAAIVPVIVDTVHVKDVFRLLGEVGQLRHRSLHAEGHLILGDARVDLRIGEGLCRQFVQLFHTVEHAPATPRVDAGRIREVEHRVAAGMEADTLVLRRYEAAAPQAREERLVRLIPASLRDHDDEGG